ncbi:MAG: DUF1684 domain-containing protein [Bacteroidales bacterium]|jgi:uncharacterized protein (DUF1684 family)|nr:DUF1684 domain-containing protein [Bacteroidales bacterium]
MKAHRLITILTLILILNSCTNPLDDAYIESMEIYRATIDKEFADPESSPLTEEGLAHFSGLEFFPADPDYFVKARFVPNPDPEAFEMETTTERRPVYVKYGEAHFRMNGEDIVLEIYQSDKAKQMEEFREYLFLPFKDLTNGEETYGGGRYIDLKIPEGDEIMIDFNKAYNPYCAYNDRYSCPVPPKANHMNIRMPAGVKAYGEH